jgi:hypothetical protein
MATFPKPGADSTLNWVSLLTAFFVDATQKPGVRMAFKISPDIVKVLIPYVLPLLKDLAARTESKVDDRLVEVVSMALSNPTVLAFLISLLGGEQAVVPADATDEEVKAAEVLKDNKELVGAAFTLFA